MPTANETTKPIPCGNTVSARIPARTALLLSRFRATDDIRIYLEGFHVEPLPDREESLGGALVMATDGHRMMVVHDELAWAREALFVPAPAKHEQTVLRQRGGKRKDQSFWITYSEEDGEGFHAAVKDAKDDELLSRPAFMVARRNFDWRKSLPDPSTLERGIRHTVNGEYLRSFFLSRADWPAADMLYDEPAVRFYQSRGADEQEDAAMPVIARYPTKPGLLGVLMPMRMYSIEPMPAWADK